MKALVVDDHQDTLELFRLALELDGIEVVTCASPSEALETNLEDFAIVITDLAMPGMDGSDFIQQLRGRGHLLPAVVVTGQTGVGGRYTPSALGACRVILKPCDPCELTLAIRELAESCIRHCTHCSLQTGATDAIVRR